MYKLVSFSILFLLVCCFGAMAQPFPPAPAAAVPLDGFSLVLIAGGAAAAAHQLRNKDK